MTKVFWGDMLTETKDKGEIGMSLISGCQEDKATPRLAEEQDACILMAFQSSISKRW